MQAALAAIEAQEGEGEAQEGEGEVEGEGAVSKHHNDASHMFEALLQQI